MIKKYTFFFCFLPEHPLLSQPVEIERRREEKRRGEERKEEKRKEEEMRGEESKVKNNNCIPMSYNWEGIRYANEQTNIPVIRKQREDKEKILFAQKSPQFFNRQRRK